MDGAKVGYVFTFRDIGERRQTEAKLQHDAMHDVLTGLPNRALFMDRLNLALARRVRRPSRAAACCFSISTASRKSTTYWDTPRAM